jgi:hypothetical protein
MFYTIYKTTNQINGKFYIGAHKTEDLNDNYLGSGKLLKRAIEKYGIENFEKEILFVFETAEEMFAKEAELVTDEFLSEHNTYNLKIGGFGGFDYINTNDSIRIPKNKKARREADKTISEKYGVINPGQLKHNREASRIRCYELRKAGKLLNTPPTFEGKKHTEETKNKISENNKITSAGIRNSQYGTMWINDGIVSKKIKASNTIPEGWVRGRKAKK